MLNVAETPRIGAEIKSRMAVRPNTLEIKMAVEFTTENFETEVLSSVGPVVVDFWAPWCGPCRQIAPIIDELAKENADVKVGKLNVDDGQSVAIKYGISNIPTILLFKSGQVVERVQGVTSKSRLQQLIDNHRM
jgi:thioredoxin 1